MGRKKPLKVSESFHKELKKIQREMKKEMGVEIPLGEIPERFAMNDPLFGELVEDAGSEENESVWDEEFMRL